MAAGVTFLVGAGIARYGSLGVLVATTALAFVVGLAVLPLGKRDEGGAAAGGRRS